MTALDLRGILGAGGSVVVNSQDFSILDLKSIAAAGIGHGGKLTIRNANQLSALDCRGIASANPGNVTFEF